MSYFKNRLRPEERLGVMHIDMLSRSLDVAIKDLGHRLDGYEHLDAELAAMQTIYRRIIQYALKDQPPEMEDIIMRQSRDFTISLERRSPIRKEQEVVMPISDEWQFVNCVLDSRCRLCLMSAAEAARCPVRALLRKYADEPEPGYAACGFIGCAVGQNKSANEQVPV